MIKLLLFCLLLLPLAVSAEADNGKQISELETAITQQQQEQQILFQQFQMLQELRRNEIAQVEQTQPSGDSIISGEAPKYEDIARQRREHAEKIHRYTKELHELYTRYQEAENERRALIEQLNGLKPGKGAAPEQKK